MSPSSPPTKAMPLRLSITAFAWLVVVVPPALTLAETHSQRVRCQSRGQLCDSYAEIPLGTSGSDHLLALTAPAQHCSKVVYIVKYGGGPGTEYGRTRPLGPGETEVMTVNVPASTVRIYALGLPGGCNTGRLTNWGVTAEVSEPHIANGNTPETAQHPLPRGHEAQQHICRVGLNLGEAQARIEVFGHELDGVIPPSQEALIATNLANTAAEMAAAEALFEEPFATDRAGKGLLPMFQGRIASAGGSTERPYGHRGREIASIATSYGNSLAVTYVSSRPDAFQHNLNCDSSILAACYHLGKATIASGTASYWADTYQSAANGAFVNNVLDGLAVALDAGHTAPDGHAKKICCSMGSPAAWEELADPGSFHTTSPLGFYADKITQVETVIASAGPLDPVCFGSDAENEWSASGRRRADHTGGGQTGLVYGGVAYSSSRTLTGNAWNWPTADGAANSAIGSCDTQDCTLLATFTNCFALAVATDGAYAWATADGVDEARGTAVSECSRVSAGGGCKVRVHFCADGSQFASDWTGASGGNREGHDGPCGFEGVWSTRWTRGSNRAGVRMVLRNAGSSIDGEYAHLGTSRISGTVAGNVLQARWTQSNGSGTATLTLESCDQWAGTWKDTTGRTGEWFGDRIREP